MSKLVLIFAIAFILGFLTHFLMVGRYYYIGDTKMMRLDKWTGAREMHRSEGWVLVLP